MAVELATAYVSLALSSRNLRSEVSKELGAVGKDAEAEGKRSGAQFAKAMGGAVAVGAAAFGGARIFSGAIREASDLSESMNAVEVTFGKNAEGIKKLGQEAANGLGLSQTEFQGISVQFSAFAEEIAGKGGDVVGTMDDLTTRGSDFASVMNLDVNEAMSLFQSGLAGETEPLRRYGIDLSAAAVEAHALATGIHDGTGEMTESEKVQARYSLLMEKTSKTQGDFANTSDSLANSQRRLSANWDNIKATIGSGLLPVMERLSNWVVDTALPGVESLTEQWQNNEGAMGALRSTLGGVFGAFQSGLTFVRENKEVLIATTSALAAGAIAYGAYTAALKIKTAATKAAAVAQRLFNTALKANPIGLVVTAIGLLVGALVYLYRNNDTARRVMQAAWSAIKSAISGVVNWFRNSAVPWMQAALLLLRTKFGELRDRASAAWDGLRSAVASGWDRIKGTFGLLRDGLSAVRDRFTTAKDGALRAWDSLRSGVSSGWDRIKGVFDKFKDGLSSLRSRFSSVKSGISSIWSGLARTVAGPIRSVVQFFNDKFLGPLEAALRKIPGVGSSISLPRIPVPSLPSSGGGGGGGRAVAMLASGGTVPGWSPHARADNIPAMLTAGEYVLPVAAVKRLRRAMGDRGLEGLRRGLPGFASGGMVGGSLGDTFAGLTRQVVDLLTDPGKVLKALGSRLLGGIGSSLPAIAAKGAGLAGVGKLVDWVKEKVGSFVGGGGGSYSGKAMPWQRIWAMVQAVAPEARMTSNYRPGARTAGFGNQSLHALRRAIDIVSPNMVATGRKLLAALPTPNEFIHTPLGGLQYSRGGRRTANFPPITRAQHYDHIHIGYADGGLVRKPFVADSGALLKPGLNLLDNRTGGPEPLGRLDRDLSLSEESIDDLLEGLALLLRSNRRDFIRDLETAGRG